MTRRLTPPEPWWADAADLIARCEISLRQAAAELGIDLSIEEADNIKGPTDALPKLAKIRGWVGKEPDSLRDVFKDLSHKDIQQLKHKITLRAEQEACASSEPTENDLPVEQPN